MTTAATARPHASLSELQEWLQTLIMHPRGVRLADDDSNVDGESTWKVVRTITPSQQLTAIERLDIYNHAYHARLLECLESEFTVFRRTVGEDAFTQFALGYTQAYPSISYTLDRFSERFVRYLSATRPERSGNGHPDWSDFLVDLALFEQTIYKVFDGPGSEGQPRLSADQLASIAPGDWNSFQLRVDPSVQIRTFRFPIHTFYEDSRNGRTPNLPEAINTEVAFSRSNFVVKFLPLQRCQSVLLRQLRLGAPLERAVSVAQASTTDAPDKLALLLFCSLRQWATAGFFLATKSAAALTQ